MECPGCGTKNPDENRFCGNCGTQLLRNDNVEAPRPDESPVKERLEREQRAFQEQENDSPLRHSRTFLGLDLPVRETHYPREGYDAESEAPPVSSLHEELPPELIEYDKRIPLIAEPGMDRRRPSSAIADTNGSADRTPARPSEPNASTNRPRGESVLTNNSIFGGLDSAVLDEEPRRVNDREPREERSAASSGTGFLDFSEPASESGSGDNGSLHGPSFLGLSSSPEDYEDDAQTVSHARRNFALVVLLLLLVLIGLQWRSIRDFGVRYAESGGIHIPGMKTKKADANASQANANNSTAVNGPTPASGEGPNIEVAPTQNPNAAANSAEQNPEQKQSTAQSTTPAEPIPLTSQDGAKSGNADKNSASADNSGASKDKGAAGNELASNSKPGKKAAGDNMPQGEDETDAEPAGDTEPAPSAVKKQPARKPVEDQMQFGAAELSQANASSDPATKANLLWKSTSKGNPIAPVQLAEMYLAGRGVPQDCEQAMVLLRSAAAKKNPRARTKLGSLYAAGQCVEQDRVQAYHWMTLALQVNPGSEWVERNRESLWGQMTASERQRAARDRSQ